MIDWKPGKKQWIMFASSMVSTFTCSYIRSHYGWRAAGLALLCGIAGVAYGGAKD